MLTGRDSNITFFHAITFLVFVLNILRVSCTRD